LVDTAWVSVMSAAWLKRRFGRASALPAALMSFFKTLQAIALLLSCLIITGCINTSYHSYGTAKKTDSLLERRVSYWLSDQFYTRLPNCVFLVPKSDSTGPLQNALESSVERHLYEKFDRVISSYSVEAAAQQNFWDLKNVVGRKHFSKKENCTSYAEVELLATEDDFLLVWARKALKISIRLYDANNGNTLWTAKHRAGRTGGSVPLSILSAGVSIARAMRVSEDSDIYESIIDDAVRRMAKTLPSAKKIKTFVHRGPQ
jgi:hypothetical protein